MKKISIFFILICLTGIHQTCNNGNEPVQSSIQSISALKKIDDCDSLLRSLKDLAIAEMEREVEANYRNVMEGYYCYDCCGYRDGGDLVMDGAEEANSPSSPPDSTSESSGDHASEYSQTNNQVSGVDEADFVKNDGKFIYILADGKFKIIEAWPPENSRIISSFPVEGTPRKLFVHNDRALIFSSLDYFEPPAYGYYSSECTYGYDCDFTGDGHPLKITLLDITDKASPVLLRETEFSGSYINSRRIGAAVYTVVAFPEIRFPEIRTWPEDLEYYCPDSFSTLLQYSLIRSKFNSLKARNRQIIENTKIADWIPAMTDTVYINGSPFYYENLLSRCEGFYESRLGDGRTLLSIVSMKMDALDPASVTTIVGRPGAVYASANAMYIASRHSSNYEGWYYEGEESIKQATTVHKFALLPEPPSTLYAGSGAVKGNILNQFSMDEYDGYLRIATTTGHVPDPNVHSTVSVLAEMNGELVVVGQIDNIAPTEDIRSVRFSGTRGFIVTFKKTDPLFVLDLSDPRNPAIAGELKIPGFSTYIHMMDKSHLLTIGFDADDQGSFAWFQGIQLQIFDVSDMANPVLVAKDVIGTRGTSSEAATDHLAFNYFAPKNLLAIPMVICEGGSGGNFGDIMTFSGLLVYRVTIQEGFNLLGGIAHQEPETEETYYGACYRWWSDSGTHVKRSIIMDDYIFSVASDLIKVQNINAIGTDVASIPLED